MKTIYKYKLGEKHPTICNTIPLQSDAQIVHIGEQNGEIFLWAIIEKERLSSGDERRFFTIGTDWEIQPDWIHVGTVQMQNGFVWHVFEEIDLDDLPF